jgi:hypothetical protein
VFYILTDSFLCCHVQEVAEELNDTLEGRDFHVQAASAKKDEGLSEGLEWLVQTMNQSKKATNYAAFTKAFQVKDEKHSKEN